MSCLFPFSLIRSLPRPRRAGHAVPWRHCCSRGPSLSFYLQAASTGLVCGTPMSSYKWDPPLGKVSREQEFKRVVQPSLFLCIAWVLCPD